VTELAKSFHSRVSEDRGISFETVRKFPSSEFMDFEAIQRLGTLLARRADFIPDARDQSREK
jgi:hypothetical protein